MVVQILTPKQKKILDFIISFVEREGFSPSLVEISKKFSKSVPTIHQFVETLRQKGYLTKEGFVSRGLSPYPINKEIFLLGKIAAGRPIEPIENPEPIKVPDFMINSPGSYYALEVRGDSMIDEGILDGDIVVVKYQSIPDLGDIVVAVTPEGATLKKFYKKGAKIELRARNKNLKGWPKLFDSGNIEIRGKFTGLIRKEK